MNEFITTSQAARVIGGSSRTIAKLFDNGTIKGFRVNADRRIHLDSFKEWLRVISTSKSTLVTLLLRLDRIASEEYGERGR